MSPPPQDRDGPSELELLEAWCDGSEQAGDALLRRCFPVLYRFFVNKVGDATDDLVQQTLIACTKHRDKIRESGVFRLWLFRIARSRLYDHLRALCRKGNHVDDDFDHVSVIEVGTSNTSRLARGRAALEVRDALRRLPVDLQVVIELHYWEEQTTAEIADVLEVPQGTVKSRLRRGREALEREIASKSEVRERMGVARPDVDALADELDTKL